MNTELIVSSPEAMEELGSSFARKAKAGDVFALVGPLGSGKTHWTKGFLKILQPDTPVTSPTFGIVNEYAESTPRIHHFDFYRLKSAEELFNLGWDDYLEDNAIIICEWANLFPEIMPSDATWIDISYLEGNERLVKLLAHS